MTLTDESGRRITLAGVLGRGGEAQVYAVAADPGLVAKIYYAPSAERTAKLHAMLAEPPTDPTAAKGHVSICWPRTLLFNQRSTSVGFLMHRVDFRSNLPVYLLINPSDRRRRLGGAFTWQYLIRTAKNIASVVAALHEHGYVIGDLNESNILVADSTMVTVVDCDSMQVPRPGTRDFHRCDVGKPEYTPPELQNCDFSRVDRTKEHDHFSLGILLFQLLMEGTHPFGGIWHGTGEPPPLEEQIKMGACPYSGSSLASPKPLAPPFEILSKDLRYLFLRCFRDGHQTPTRRPTPLEWLQALASAEASLRICQQNAQHVYGGHLAQCPWCERAQLLQGWDPFPPPTAGPPPHSAATGTASAPPAPRVVPAVSPTPVAPTTVPLAAAPAPSPQNWLPGLLIVALIVGAVLMGRRMVTNAIAATAAQKASAEDQARRAETTRLMELARERARILDTIAAEWRATSGRSSLRITTDGEAINAEYRAGGSPHNLRGSLMPDNRVRLASEQVGKIVNPGRFWTGPFSQEAWLQLSQDGSQLIATFSGGGADVTMMRTASTAFRGNSGDQAPTPEPAPEPVRTEVPRPTEHVVVADPIVRRTAVTEIAPDPTPSPTAAYPRRKKWD